jgi:hypothetical protein
MEPILLLLFSESDAREIRFELSITNLRLESYSRSDQHTSSRIKLLDVK